MHNPNEESKTGSGPCYLDVVTEMLEKVPECIYSDTSFPGTSFCFFVFFFPSISFPSKVLSKQASSEGCLTFQFFLPVVAPFVSL